MNKIRNLAYFLVFLCSFAVIDMVAMQASYDVRKMQEHLEGIAASDQKKHINEQGFLQAEARDGHADVVELLIKLGAVVDGLNKEGKTALGEAARMAHLDAAKVLVKYGADVNKKEQCVATPIQAVIAGFYGQLSIFNAVGVPLNGADSKKQEYAAVGKYLIDQGAHLDQKNIEKDASIQSDIQAQTVSLEQELIQYQEDCAQRRQQSQNTALTLAQALHHRLGQQSPLGLIGQQLLHDISWIVGDCIKTDPSWQVKVDDIKQDADLQGKKIRSKKCVVQ